MFILGACPIDIDMIVPTFTVGLVNLVKVIIPIILVAYGMIDLAKAVMGNDEKAMKEAQNKFIKRIVYAVIIFFLVAIVQLIFGVLASASKGSSSGEISKTNVNACIACFISDTSQCKNSASDSATE